MPAIDGSNIVLVLSHTETGHFHAVTCTGAFPAVTTFPVGESLRWSYDGAVADTGLLKITFNNASTSSHLLSAGSHVCTSVGKTGTHEYTMLFHTPPCGIVGGIVKCTFTLTTVHGPAQLVLLPRKKGASNPTHHEIDWPHPPPGQDPPPDPDHPQGR